MKGTMIQDTMDLNKDPLDINNLMESILNSMTSYKKIIAKHLIAFNTQASCQTRILSPSRCCIRTRAQATVTPSPTKVGPITLAHTVPHFTLQIYKQMKSKSAEEGQ